MRWWLLVIIGGVFAPHAGAQSTDLVLQARHILTHRCASCHRDAAWQHLLLPDTSNYERIAPQIHKVLELVEDGSMPPFDKKLPEAEVRILREWSQLAEPKRRFATDYDDLHALRTVAADVEREKNPDYRYITLAVPLSEATGPLPTLQARRQELQAALDRVIAPALRGRGLSPLDAAGTVFRLDLRAIGWHQPLLQRVIDNAPSTERAWNPFDVLLLDYPWGKVYPAVEEYRTLRDWCLGPARMARPIPFVRGDWFIADAVNSSVGADLIALNEIAAGLGDPRPAPPLAVPRQAPTPPSGAFEEAKASRIYPIDSLHFPQIPETTPFDFDVELLIVGADEKTVLGQVDAQGRQVGIPKLRAGKDTFWIGLRLKARGGNPLPPSASIHAELVWIDAKGVVDPLTGQNNLRIVGEEMRLIGRKDNDNEAPFEFDARSNGRERIILFASTQDIHDQRGQRYVAGAQLDGQGSITRARIDRFIHPYAANKELQARPPILFDKRSMIKRTIELDVTATE